MANAVPLSRHIALKLLAAKPPGCDRKSNECDVTTQTSYCVMLLIVYKNVLG